MAPNQDDPMTLTVLGCGTLGTAILSGILSDSSKSDDIPDEEFPPETPTRFITCVTSSQSAKRVKDAVGHLSRDLTILQNENVKGVQEADVVLLGFKPYQLKVILEEEGMREALAGKLVISILAGVPVSQIEDTIYPKVHGSPPFPPKIFENLCRIVRVMPNTASLISQSMTVIATSTPPLPKEDSALTSWMFSQVGRVIHLPPHLMDASTALCGAGPAYCALILEALADGAVAMGIPRAAAQEMAAQTMRGAAGLVLNGEHPAVLKDKVCTPGGATIGGLLVLEEGSVRGTVARSVREATVVASQLGKGKQGVNGTRH